MCATTDGTHTITIRATDIGGAVTDAISSPSAVDIIVFTRSPYNARGGLIITLLLDAYGI